MLLYNLVIILIATFQYFTQAYTLTNGRGDPNNATLFINLELFREAFVFSRMGYGAAIAWLLFADRPAPDASPSSPSPASASTTPAASDDGRGADDDPARLFREQPDRAHPASIPGQGVADDVRRDPHQRAT